MGAASRVKAGRLVVGHPRFVGPMTPCFPKTRASEGSLGTVGLTKNRWPGWRAAKGPPVRPATLPLLRPPRLLGAEELNDVGPLTRVGDIERMRDVRATRSVEQ